jgi:YcxB-like protein
MAGETRYTPTEADHGAARLESWRAFWRGRRAARTVLLVVGMWTGLGAVNALSEGRPLIWDMLGYGVCSVLFLLVVLVVGPFVVRLTSRRLYRQQKTLHTEMTFAWSAEGIRSASHRGEIRLSWSDLHAWRRGRRSFLFYFNERMFCFLPYRALAEEQKREIDALAEASGLPHR